MSEIIETNAASFDGTACRMCGSKLGFLQRIAHQAFCSLGHRVEFFRLREEMGLQRLLQSHQPVRALSAIEQDGHAIKQEMAPPEMPDPKVEAPKVATPGMAGLVEDPNYILDVIRAPHSALPVRPSVRMALPAMRLDSAWDKLAGEMAASHALQATGIGAHNARIESVPANGRICTPPGTVELSG